MWLVNQRIQFEVEHNLFHFFLFQAGQTFAATIYELGEMWGRHFFQLLQTVPSIGKCLNRFTAIAFFDFAKCECAFGSQFEQLQKAAFGRFLSFYQECLTLFELALFAKSFAQRCFRSSCEKRAYQRLFGYLIDQFA